MVKRAFPLYLVLLLLACQSSRLAMAQGLGRLANQVMVTTSAKRPRTSNGVMTYVSGTSQRVFTAAGNCAESASSSGFLLSFPCDEGLVQQSTCNAKLLPAIKDFLSQLAALIYTLDPPAIMVSIVNGTANSPPVSGTPTATQSGKVKFSNNSRPSNYFSKGLKERDAADASYRYPQAVAKQIYNSTGAERFPKLNSSRVFMEYDLILSVNAAWILADKFWYTVSPKPARGGALSKVDFRVALFPAVLQGLGLQSDWMPFSLCPLNESNPDTSCSGIVLPSFAISLPESVPELSSSEKLDEWVGANMRVDHWLEPQIFDSYVAISQVPAQRNVWNKTLQLVGDLLNSLQIKNDYSWSNWLSWVASTKEGTVAVDLYERLSAKEWQATIPASSAPTLGDTILFSNVTGAAGEGETKDFTRLIRPKNLLDAVYSADFTADLARLNGRQFVTLETMSSASKSVDGSVGFLGPSVSGMLESIGYVLLTPNLCANVSYGKFITEPVPVSQVIWRSAKVKGSLSPAHVVLITIACVLVTIALAVFGLNYKRKKVDR